MTVIISDNIEPQNAIVIKDCNGNETELTFNKNITVGGFKVPYIGSDWIDNKSVAYKSGLKLTGTRKEYWYRRSN